MDTHFIFNISQKVHFLFCPELDNDYYFRCTDGEYCGHPNYLNLDSVGHNAVHYILSEGVKMFVCPSHELRLQQVPTTAVVLKNTQVQLHGQIYKQEHHINAKL